MFRKVKTTDAGVDVYGSPSLKAMIIAHLPAGVDIQLTEGNVHGDREWMEAKLSDGRIGFVLAPTARSHTTLEIPNHQTDGKRKSPVMFSMLIVGSIVLIVTMIWTIVSNQKERNREKAIVDDVVALVEQCKALGNEQTIKLRGKALVWDMTSYSRSDANSELPDELRATSFDKPITVFMVYDRVEWLGTYTPVGQGPKKLTGGQQSGYAHVAEIAVAYWPEKKAVGFDSVMGPDPPTLTTERNPQYGAATDGRVAHWIAFLPNADAH